MNIPRPCFESHGTRTAAPLTHCQSRVEESEGRRSCAVGRTVAEPRGPAADPGRGRRLGRGDETVGSPHRAQISELELFEPIPLTAIKQTAPCRAIRGNGISVYSTLPPSLAALRSRATGARRPWSTPPRAQGRTRGPPSGSRRSNFPDMFSYNV